MEKRCDIATIVRDRIFFEAFSKEVESQLDEWIGQGINCLIEER
jgi:hypothetical protein